MLNDDNEQNIQLDHQKLNNNQNENNIEKNIASDEEDISINKVPQSKTFNKLNSNTASTQEQTNTQSNNSIALFTLESHSKLEMWDCFILSETDCGKTYGIYSNYENSAQRYQMYSSKVTINKSQRSFYQLNRTKI